MVYGSFCHTSENLAQYLSHSIYYDLPLLLHCPVAIFRVPRNEPVWERVLVAPNQGVEPAQGDRFRLHLSGVAQEGGGGGYHFASSAGLPKLDSTLEILFVTACASQSAQTAQSEGDLLLVCRQKGTSPSSAGRRGGGSLVCYPTLGVRQTRQSDSHFRLVLGLPYTITINIPWLLSMK